MTIALLLEPADPDAGVWTDALRASMPGERIELFAHLSDAERRAVPVAICTNPNNPPLAELPALEWLQSLWAGVDAVAPLAAARSLPLVRLIDPALTRAMSEAVLTWCLWLLRGGPEYARQQAARCWAERPYSAPEDCRVTVLGLGELGGASARRLAANGFQVRGWSRRPCELPGVDCRAGHAALNELLATTDLLVVLLPLSSGTRGLLDRKRLRHLPASAAVLNFAREGILPEWDLLAALSAGSLRHAVLDVFRQEPLPTGHPLWSRSDVTVLPHVAAPSTPESAAAQVASNVATWRDSGAPPERGRVETV